MLLVATGLGGSGVSEAEFHGDFIARERGGFITRRREKGVDQGT